MTQNDASAPATLQVKGLRAAVGDREILRGSISPSSKARSTR